MNCVVYKGDKSPDKYLFVREDTKVSDIPKALLHLMGELQVVTSLNISIDTKLAQACAATVICSLNTQGFYLQMPKQKNCATLDSESIGS